MTDLPGDYEIQLCTAINNIEHILVEGLEPLMKKLNVEALFATLTKIRSHIPECHKALKVLNRVVDAAENADGKMMEIVKVVSEKVKLIKVAFILRTDLIFLQHSHIKKIHQFNLLFYLFGQNLKTKI